MTARTREMTAAAETMGAVRATAAGQGVVRAAEVKGSRAVMTARTREMTAAAGMMGAVRAAAAQAARIPMARTKRAEAKRKLPLFP